MSGRLRAIGLPCWVPIPHQSASLIVSVLSTLIHFTWTYGLARISSGMSEVQVRKPSNADLRQVTEIRSFAMAGCYFSISLGVAYLMLVGFSIRPQREWLKNLSRLVWVGWAGTWCMGMVGIIGYTLESSYLTENCSSKYAAANCGLWWKKAQVFIVGGVILTLIFDFYGNVVISSFVHTLHPHLFYQDTDSEEDYYETDDDKSPLPLSSYPTYDYPSASPLQLQQGARRRSPSARRALDVSDEETINRGRSLKRWDYPSEVDEAEFVTDSGEDTESGALTSSGRFGRSTGVEARQISSGRQSVSRSASRRRSPQVSDEE